MSYGYGDSSGGGGDGYGDSSGGGGGGGYGDSSGTSYGGGGGGYSNDLSGAHEYASEHAGSSGDRGMFQSALGMISGKSQQLQGQHVDENDMVQQHQSYYGGGGGGGQSTSGGMGSAAAMQALKMFGSGGGSSGGGSSQNAFVGMAMGQASKLFGESRVTHEEYQQLTTS